jgi:ferredoxin hydrogenase large subunit/hydrogenase large subunit
MTAALHIARVEGGLELSQDDDGRIRLETQPTRELEQGLAGRSILDAVHLTQLVTGDGGISHALAAVTAWEQAGRIHPPANGILLRDLLHALSMLHAQVRQFYFQALPDYVSAGDLAAYRGTWPALQRVSRALRGREVPAWARHTFPHPFSSSQVDRLAEHQMQASLALQVLQRCMAAVGGKFPVAMSIVPGGCSSALSDGLLLRLRGYLDQVREFLENTVFEDGLLVVSAYPRLKTLGRGVKALYCAGTTGEGKGPAQSMVPAGMFVGDRLEALEGTVLESIHRAYYRVAGDAPAFSRLTPPAPEKEGAYSWIKAPRYRNQPMETGALARLVVTRASGSRAHLGRAVEDVERAVGAPLAGGATGGGSTAAARLLARLAEVPLLRRRCEYVLGQLYPNQPTIAPDRGAVRVTGQGEGNVESPAGAINHRIVLERGRIARYDMVSPSTWNGSPEDERGEAGSLELALNSSRLNLREREDRLAASRIVHSFFFSSADAVH